MRSGNLIWAVLLICFLANPVMAQPGKGPVAAPEEKTECDPLPGETSPEDVVIGGNLTTSHTVKDAMQLMGIPEFIKLNRGTDPGLDNIEITYTKYDLVLRTLTEGKVVEGIEIGPDYKGSFGRGDIRLGANFDDVVQSFGIPASLTAQVARYPDQGIYFLFSDANLLSVKTYSKNTRLLDARLMNP